MANNKENLIIKSLLIVQYISLYAKFEKLLLDIFNREVIKLDHMHKNKLYFMHGCFMSSNVFYEYDQEHFIFSGSKKTWRFNDEEAFKTLNLNKIIRFDRKEKIIPSFNNDIPSILRSTVNHSFHDTCLKLVSMRNNITHEFDSLNFENKDIIEQFSSQIIQEHKSKCEWLEEYDLSNVDDISISIFSNYVYMKVMFDKLTHNNA